MGKLGTQQARPHASKWLCGWGMPVSVKASRQKDLVLVVVVCLVFCALWLLLRKEQ